MTTITAIPAAEAAVATAEPRPGSPVTDIVVLSRRNLLRIIRTPRLLITSAIPPALFVVLFRYVFGGAIHTPGPNYADYLLPTIMILAMLLGATTAVAFATDLADGMIDRFRSLPIARLAVLAGRTTADLLRTGLVLAVSLGVGTAVGFRFHNGFWLGLAGLGLLLAFGYAMSWEMIWVALKVRDPETAQVAGFLPVVPLVFASSGFVPVFSLPGWLQGFAKVQPVSVAVNAVRALTQGGPLFHWLWLSGAWIGGILIVFGVLAVREYRKV